MHLCLAISELLRTIITNTTQDGTLASLARTCKAFKDPALDVLYAELSSLYPLVKCMPQDLWEDEADCLSFVRPMKTSDWDVFRRYARRVRSFNHSHTFDSKTVTVSVFQALSMHPTLSSLVPNLRQLSWNDTREAPTVFLRFIIGPSLVSCTIYQTSGRAITIVPALGALCPFMKRIDLPASQPSSRAKDIISDALCNWNNLESLKCGIITGKALLHIAGLPSLKALTFRIPTIPTTFHGSSLGEGAFPALESLTIFSYNSRDPCFTAFFKALKTPIHISSFWMTAGQYDDGDPRANPGNHDIKPSVDVISESLVSLTSKCCAETLGSITICHDLEDLPIQFPANLAITFNTLRLLLPFRHLRTLNIDPSCAFSLDDAALAEMAIAWPNMEDLGLGTAYGWRAPSKITLQGLIPLLRNCPKLMYLGIVIDATVVPPRTKHESNIQHEWLQELVLADSPITKPAYVSAFLSDALSSIPLISSWDGELTNFEGAKKYRRRWAQVRKMMGAFKSVRGQERRRWKKEGRRERRDGDQDTEPESESDISFEDDENWDTDSSGSLTE
ncbi:hypothetical protein BV22DRAFT_1116525 [Leucogyrophana mollusca]|uniref:Uncharacterized protein n=1 Tax=Leucogyrophana mollusca TaxID=85980 RepID=A0ACB8BWY1_9AGAM|nr:hypothetical protein BV22DRAFT_1116525 [Leucogyrophana mollusca]